MVVKVDEAGRLDTLEVFADKLIVFLPLGTSTGEGADRNASTGVIVSSEYHCKLSGPRPGLIEGIPLNLQSVKTRIPEGNFRVLQNGAEV